MRRLIHHPHGYGFDCRAGHTARFVGKGKFSPVNVDFHTGQGIYQGNGIRARCFRRFCHLADVRYIGT